MSSLPSPKDRFSALFAGEPALSAWLASPDPFTQEAFLRADYDLVMLDMQHGLLDRSDVRDAITRAYGFGKGAFVRVPVSGFGAASWALDMGARGVIMPMVESADDARNFVKHMKYPPLGLRSFGPSRAAPLAKDGEVDAYVETANTETFAFAMIETRTALDALDEIAAIDGVDGLFVGPSDLSIALSDDSRPDVDGNRLKDAMQRVVEAAEKHGKVAAAYAGDAAHANTYWSRGFDYVGISVDLKVIAAAAQALAKEAKG
ncbi:aldolase/citrate lyase family protein [Fulvimarina sp. MAC8]|uniref:HpcH/HpaI aldolase family protein n=1 Tax=Fulvimarina sp. MAC8 TaxID=3162874 RepID=UPI0032EA98DD